MEEEIMDSKNVKNLFTLYEMIDPYSISYYEDFKAPTLWETINNNI
jgi:hypothetical protein